MSTSDSRASVARLTDAGIEVTYCIVTDGDAGGAETGHAARARWRRKRREEQTAAAAVVGVHDLHFLGYPDGRVESTLDLRRDISRVIRQVRPASGDDAVAGSQLGPHLREPSRPPRGRRGDDRRGVSRRAQPVGASRSSKREGLEPWTVDEVWLGCRRPEVTHYIDITDAIDRKIEALLCHKSQLPDPEATGEMVRGWTSMIATSAGLPEGRFAEAVRVVDTAEPGA